MGNSSRRNDGLNYNLLVFHLAPLNHTFINNAQRTLTLVLKPCICRCFSYSIHSTSIYSFNADYDPLSKFKNYQMKIAKQVRTSFQQYPPFGSNLIFTSIPFPFKRPSGYSHALPSIFFQVSYTSHFYTECLPILPSQSKTHNNHNKLLL